MWIKKPVELNMKHYTEYAIKLSKTMWWKVPITGFLLALGGALTAHGVMKQNWIEVSCAGVVFFIGLQLARITLLHQDTCGHARGMLEFKHALEAEAQRMVREAEAMSRE